MTLRVEHLNSGYGDSQVLWDVSFELHPGEIVALLGPNGAGKSTTLLTISGLLPVKAGRVRALGVDVASCRHPEAIARLGVAHVPEDALDGRLGVIGDDEDEEALHSGRRCAARAV